MNSADHAPLILHKRGAFIAAQRAWRLLLEELKRNRVLKIDLTRLAGEMGTKCRALDGLRNPPNQWPSHHSESRLSFNAR